MSEVTVVLYDPPARLMDALRESDTFITSSFGNAVEQRDAAHRREAEVTEELQFVQTRYTAALLRETELLTQLSNSAQKPSLSSVEGQVDE